MSSHSVEDAIRTHVQRGLVIRLRASGKPFEVDGVESDSIVLLFGKKKSPTRLKWEWLEGVVPYLREHGHVPIGGAYVVEGKLDTLDGYLKQFIKRATANWVAALLEEAGVVEVFKEDRHFAVRLAGGADEPDDGLADQAASSGREQLELPEVRPTAPEAPSDTDSGDARAPLDAGRRRAEFSDGAHRDALLRRRIKFVVEKGAMARLFRRGTHGELQTELFRRLRPSDIACLASEEEFDQWLDRLLQDDCWVPYSRHALAEDRWAYFAKLINIVIYEIVANRELFCEPDWRRVQQWLHLPIDSKVVQRLRQLDPSFTAPGKLHGMTQDEYQHVQHAARRLARKYRVPPIWFEDAYAD